MVADQVGGKDEGVVVAPDPVQITEAIVVVGGRTAGIGDAAPSVGALCWCGDGAALERAGGRHRDSHLLLQAAVAAPRVFAKPQHVVPAWEGEGKRMEENEK